VSTYNTSEITARPDFGLMLSLWAAAALGAPAPGKQGFVAHRMLSHQEVLGAGQVSFDESSFTFMENVDNATGIRKIGDPNVPKGTEGTDKQYNVNPEDRGFSESFDMRDPRAKLALARGRMAQFEAKYARKSMYDYLQLLDAKLLTAIIADPFTATAVAAGASWLTPTTDIKAQLQNARFNHDDDVGVGDLNALTVTKRGYLAMQSNESLRDEVAVLGVLTPGQLQTALGNFGIEHLYIAMTNSKLSNNVCMFVQEPNTEPEEDYSTFLRAYEVIEGQSYEADGIAVNKYTEGKVEDIHTTYVHSKDDTVIDIAGGVLITGIYPV
jgi:hypothetical protein